MSNLRTAGHQEFRETYFCKTCREQREISVHCFRLQRDFQHEKCTDTAFGEKAWNLTAETVFLPSRWLHLWTIPDEWTPSSAFEKETSAGKSALNFFMLTICSSTFFNVLTRIAITNHFFSTCIRTKGKVPCHSWHSQHSQFLLLNLTLKQPCVRDCDDTQSISGGAISGWWWVPN